MATQLGSLFMTPPCHSPRNPVASARPEKWPKRPRTQHPSKKVKNKKENKLKSLLPAALFVVALLWLLNPLLEFSVAVAHPGTWLGQGLGPGPGPFALFQYLSLWGIKTNVSQCVVLGLPFALLWVCSVFDEHVPHADPLPQYHQHESGPGPFPGPARQFPS